MVCFQFFINSDLLKQQISLSVKVDVRRHSNAILKTINNKSRIISILLTKKIIISDNILAQTESVFSFGDGLNLRMTLSINKNVN